jgi:hypothetical protein
MRDGGYGGLDLYVSRRDDHGRWSTPMNLGPMINTGRDERTIAMHPEGTRLYFSSDRADLPNAGDLDIFVGRTVAR